MKSPGLQKNTRELCRKMKDTLDARHEGHARQFRDELGDHARLASLYKIVDKAVWPESDTIRLTYYVYMCNTGIYTCLGFA